MGSSDMDDLVSLAIMSVNEAGLNMIQNNEEMNDMNDMDNDDENVENERDQFKSIFLRKPWLDLVKSCVSQW